MNPRYNRLSPELAAEVDARLELPTLPFSTFRPGDIVMLDCLSDQSEPCGMAWRIDEVGTNPQYGDTDVVITVMANASDSPAVIGERYNLSNNGATKHFTLLKVDEIQKSSYQWMVKAVGQLPADLIRTAFIADITILRDDEVIKPFHDSGPITE